MAPAFLTVRISDAQRFPVGTQVGLYDRHDVGTGVVPLARALHVATVDATGEVELTTPLWDRRTVDPKAVASVPDRMPFAVAAVVNGEPRVTYVWAEQGHG